MRVSQKLLFNLSFALCSALVAIATSAAPEAASPNSFVAFESGHVRPLAMSADKTLVFAVNTPDNRL